MKCLTSLATIATVGLLAACSAPTADPGSGRQPEASDPSSPPGQNAATPGSPTEPAAVLDVDANLRALRDLQVVDVSGLVENIPETANCYNVACPGHEKEFDDAKTHAAAALAAFTHTALEAAADSSADARIESNGTCYVTDEKNLQTLKDLHVVTLGDLVLEKPESFDNCYHVARAHKLARIVAALSKQ